MKRLTTLLLTAAIALSSTAQTALEEIRANKYLAGSNYLDYNRQLPTKKLTPAPKGYIPYYMSHYGRHGSRWLINDDSYTSVTETAAAPTVEAYLNYRMLKSGYSGKAVFGRRPARDIFRYSGGIPRLINVIANKSLMLAYGYGVHGVSCSMVRE